MQYIFIFGKLWKKYATHTYGFEHYKTNLCLIRHWIHDFLKNMQMYEVQSPTYHNQDVGWCAANQNFPLIVKCFYVNNGLILINSSFICIVNY